MQVATIIVVLTLGWAPCASLAHSAPVYNPVVTPTPCSHRVERAQAGTSRPLAIKARYDLGAPDNRGARRPADTTRFPRSIDDERREAIIDTNWGCR